MSQTEKPNSLQALDDAPNIRGQIVIRAARASDCEGITALANLPAYRFGTLRLPHQTIEETRKRLESAGPGRFFLVAELDNVIVGTASLQRFSGRRAHAASLGMGVHDGYVGRGIGSLLLRELIDMADRWLGIERLELTVYTDNKPAIALYERHGFVVEGTHRAFAFRDGDFVDAFAMARLRQRPRLG